MAAQVPNGGEIHEGCAPRRRVVITGIGAVTPIGTGAHGVWQGVRRGVSAVRRITRFDPTPFPSRIAAEVDGFDPHDFMDARRARRLDRFSQFGLAAARLAVEDARLEINGARDETGVYLGSALGGVAFGEEQHANYLRGGVRAVHPLLALAVFGGAGSCNIAIELGLTGPNIANANSCASGAIAIGEAFHAIRAGRATVLVAGGVEAPLAPLTFGAFALIKAMSTANDEPERASRPFDRRRDGFVMAEGAALLLLEDYGHALRRGAAIYAEVLGYATTNDAYHMTAPQPEGEQAARAVTLALAEAGVAPHELDYINAHGSSTPLNDTTETLVFKRALGEAAGGVPISGTKGLHGHALGAAGAIEAAICALVMRHDWLPPTANLEEPDPACDLDYIRGEGRERRVHYVLSTSFGFGGINAALVLGEAA
ncbi:MAG: beta-ketoacyl-ACP synthase II [Dehalococcoidia bacterium]